MNYADVAPIDADECGSAATGVVTSSGKEFHLGRTAPQTTTLYPMVKLYTPINPTTLTGNPARIVVKRAAPAYFNKINLNYGNPNFWFDASSYTTEQTIGPIKFIAIKAIQIQVTTPDSANAIMLTKKWIQTSFYWETSRLRFILDQTQLDKTKRPVSVQTQAFSCLVGKNECYQLKRSPAIMPQAA